MKSTEAQAGLVMVRPAFDCMIFRLVLCFGEKRWIHPRRMHANTLFVYLGHENGIEMDQPTDYMCSCAQYQRIIHLCITKL